MPAQDDSATTSEDTAINVPVLDNDNFAGTPVVTGFTNGAHGTVFIVDLGPPGFSADDLLFYVPAADFYKGPYETAARPDELLTEVRFPAQPKGQGYGFDEVSQRHGDFAIVAAGCTLAVEDGVCRTVRLGYGGVGPHALRVAEAEAALTGQPATPENFAKAAHAAAGHVRPTSDVHADENYRRDLVRALTTRVLAAALARCS